MKSYGGLWQHVVSFGNLVAAAQEAARGKGSRQEVAGFLWGLESRCLQLEDELRDGTWLPGSYRVFVIREPKKRLICAAPFADRVVHHALSRVVAPIWERSFIHHSYACRPGKGTHRARTRAQQMIRKYPYYLKLDIAGYFASIDHQVIRDRLAARFREKPLLGLFKTIIDHAPPDCPPGKGLPIGNLTSQHLANVYLDRADHFVCEVLRPGGYVRYMDDMVLFGPDKAGLWRCLAALRELLEQDLKLRIKPGSIHCAPSEHGLSFLGFRIFPGVIRLKRENWLRFKRKFAHREGAYLESAYDAANQLVQSANGMVQFVSAGNTCNLRRSYFAGTDV